ncbi:deoxycytidyl transferase [Cadophora gregata]|uniref:deoxycytidyl transferase n=1 Tax=Cadophora gregata TaxID=51156 RepID=UPI0026DCFE11|nr:deoxycytidyl transferase [Cadophora gregata]KAK0126465.1 deoxycytidyl transferase [Cadophora gregata]
MGSRLEKNSESVRKRIEAHTFEDEEGEEYKGSKFGGFSDYFRRKKIKLQNLDAELRSESADKPRIFRGVVAHVNGYTQPSLNDLHRIIVAYGGGFMQYLDGKTTVTHIIAANLTPKKAIEFHKYRIVKPAWIVDSVAAGKLLPWNSYRVVDEGVGQRLLGFNDGKMVSQTNTQQRGYREQTSTSWYSNQVQSVVDDIDDEDGAHFPSTQNVAFNGTSAFMEDLAPGQPRREQKDPVKAIKVLENPESSGDFEVSSSLEDALNSAAIRDAARRSSPLKTGQSVPVPKEYEDTQVLPHIQKPTIEVETIDAAAPSESMEPSNSLQRSRDVESPSPSKRARIMTAEEHNAILLADPHIKKSSTANPDFLKQFYSESRLHHLSTWKADLKSRFQQMASEKSASQKSPTKKKPGARRYIMHVDFDSFFCAVSLKNAPDYIDKPTVVAHGSGTGSEIASCNYPARSFGVKNGMWMKKALELCPNIKVLPYDFPAYEEASKGFYDAILDVGGIVQSVSVDEALVDITSLCLPAGGTDGLGVHEGSIWREQEKADQIADDLRKQIKDKTGCEVSVGIGANILLAKVALRKAKPAGQHQIKPEDVLDFIGELTVQDLPGVAYSIGGKLEEVGVKFVKDVRQLTKDRLMTVLGPKTGEKIWDYSRGIDRTEVGEQVIRKSVSAEVNWGIRFISQPEAEEFVQNLCIELQRRLVDQGVKGRQLTMKIMRKSADAPLDPPKHLGHGKCDTFNKSIVLGVATNNAEVIGREAVSILRSYGFSPGELRGLGVQMTKLELLKASNIKMPDGSQRRINWGAAPPKLGKQITADPIDDPQTPSKPKYTSTGWDKSNLEEPPDPMKDIVTPTKPKSSTARLLFGKHVADDIESPQKTKDTPSVHPAAVIARANAADQSAKKVLNVMGTQFIIPSQIDPQVLDALPHDIRSKLMAQSKSLPSSRAQSPFMDSRSNSVTPEEPPRLPSRLDPDVFEALPDDMKAEVLASYASRAAPAQQGLLPQSPRKGLHIVPPKRATPTKKRGRGRPPGARAKPKQDSHSNLTQANFVASKGSTSRDQGGDSDGYNSDTLDPEFLAALPEEMRQEIMNEHRRKRLAKKGGLMTTAAMKKRPPPGLLLGQRKIRLPPREPRPTFTTQELSTLPQLRDTLSAWFREFADDGPHPDDVAAMERYLRRVILDERDMSKVAAIVKWLEWLIDEADDDNEGTKIWSDAFDGIKDRVQLAVRERGLGKLEL